MTRPIPTTKAGVDTPVTLINAFSLPMALEEQRASAQRFLDDPVFADAKVRPVAYQAVVTVAPGDTLR